MGRRNSMLGKYSEDIAAIFKVVIPKGVDHLKSWGLSGIEQFGNIIYDYESRFYINGNTTREFLNEEHIVIIPVSRFGTPSETEKDYLKLLHAAEFPYYMYITEILYLNNSFIIHQSSAKRI